MIVGSFSAVVGLCLLQGKIAHALKFSTEQAKPAANLIDFKFVSRVYIPYGPDLYAEPTPQSGNDQPYRGYAYGMGAAEEAAYDHKNHYLYTASLPGYVMVVDYKNPTKPVVTDLSFDLSHLKSEIGSLVVCSETGKLIVTLSDERRLDIYQAVQRGDPKTPTLLKSIGNTGGRPRTVLPNKKCDMVAIANQNLGDDLEQGSVAIVRDLDAENPTVTFIPLDGDNNEWDDAYFLQRGLHMPLTLNALKYWDTHSPIAEAEDFANVIQNYRASIFLEPKRLSWGNPDETELLVNLQENNGVVRINVNENRPVAVASYGLKDHSVIPIDINGDDKDCVLKTYRDLFALRSPDSISTFSYNGRLYLITANEGDNKKYGNEFEDGLKGKELFKGDKFALKNVYVDEEILDPNNTSRGSSSLFNEDCEGGDCVNSATISVGSTAIDYETDWENPTFHRMVLFGGRGWTIYELPEDPDSLLKVVFDSAASFEGVGCRLFPWSHNSIHDEEDAPLTGPNNTLAKWAADDEKLIKGIMEKNDPEENGCADQGDGTPGACPLGKRVDEESTSEGTGIEAVTVGMACGRLVAVTATEKASVGYLFDITDITSPSLVKSFHLSPESETLSPGLAYNQGKLGEIDPETILFLSASESPTGKPAVLYIGAWSGTASFWEFDCEEPDFFAKTGATSSATKWGGAIDVFLGLLVSAFAILGL